MLPLSLLTPANIAKPWRFSLRLLRVNYFYVWGRTDKMEMRQGLNMEVDL